MRVHRRLGQQVVPSNAVAGTEPQTFMQGAQMRENRIIGPVQKFQAGLAEEATD